MNKTGTESMQGTFKDHRRTIIFFAGKTFYADARKVKESAKVAYRVEGQVSPHVAGSDAVEHGGASQRTQTLGNDVEESPEQGHLGANQVGEGDSRVDVSSANVADGLNKGGSRQPKAEGNMEDVVRPGGPAKGRPEPKKDKEHGAVKLGKHRPPERHGSELPHGGKKGSKINLFRKWRDGK